LTQRKVFQLRSLQPLFLGVSDLESAKTWTVGDVQDTSFGFESGKGFNVGKVGRGPVLTLVYANQADADEARKFVKAAIDNAVYVGTPLR